MSPLGDNLPEQRFPCDGTSLALSPHSYSRSKWKAGRPMRPPARELGQDGMGLPNAKGFTARE
jgi:hypothetical protein